MYVNPWLVCPEIPVFIPTSHGWLNVVTDVPGVVTMFKLFKVSINVCQLV